MRSMRSRWLSRLRKAAGDAPVELDQSVDGFGAAAARTVGVEVAEERLPPLPRGAPEPCDLRDRRGRQAGEHGLGETSSGRVGVLMEAGADLLGVAVGDLDLDMLFAGVNAVRNRACWRSLRCS